MKDQNTTPPTGGYSEALSAIVDGEATAEELHEYMDLISKDEQARQEWEELHLIDAMLQNPHVAASLAKQEPFDWENARNKVIAHASNRRKIDLHAIVNEIRDRFSVLWIGGFALAASLLLAVSLVVVMQPQFGLGGSGQLASGESNSGTSLLASDGPAANTQALPVVPVRLDRNGSSNQSAPTVADKNEDESKKESRGRSRSLPPKQKPVQRDLVRLVSD